MDKKIQLYHEAQSWFARNQEIHKSTRHRALEIICAKVAEVMGITRVGIWFFTIDRETFYEEMTYNVGKSPSHGNILLRKDYPKYFNLITEARTLYSNDTLEDEDLDEFVDGYFKPFGVRALLDSPIFSDGEMLGIFCCENDKVVNWDLFDKSFVGNCADLIGRLIESEKRHTYEKELRHRINYLENDLKRKLDDLNEAKLSLDLALEGAQVGKWDWELTTNRLVLNRTWFTKLGYEYNELPQDLETFRKALHPEDVDRVLEEIQKHCRGESVFYECRFRMITKSGDIQWCLDRGCIIYRDNDGTPLRLTGVNVNVTPIIQLEENLVVSEQQLKSMIQSLPTAVAMFDKDYRYLAFSTLWEQEWKDFGKPYEGQPISENFRKQWLPMMDLAFKGETMRKDEDLLEISPGVEMWLRWVIQPWKNSKQEIGGIVLMAENITSRKQTEMRLAQASKLSALGEMAGGIAHEINNPLSIIKGYIDLLRRHSSRHSLNEALLSQYIEKMDGTVGRISRIVNGMRRFSRDSSVDEKVKYSLNKVIEETLDICQERINNNGTSVEVKFFEGDPWVYCRPIEISQVILNLVNNSYQATSSFPHPWIKINLEERGEIYRLTVSDSGSGISAAVRQKLFQPFFTTKDIGVGTGLGLSISRGIIEEHKGSLYYQEDCANTTFVIELPRWKPEQTA